MTLPIGQKLKQQRQAQSLSLEKIAQATHIRVHYLRALEEGDLDALPSAVQARGFLRAYADYLGVPVDPAQVRQFTTPAPQPETPADSAAETRVSVEVTPSAAETIFAEIGRQLKNQRELLGFSLGDVEENTHLRDFYLQALESGNMAALPSPVQGRGMLSNYASFLGIDPEPLLLKFAEGLQAQLAVRRGDRRGSPGPQGLAPPSGLRRLVSGDLIFGGFLILALTVFVIWAAIRISAVQADAAQSPTAPPIAGVLLSSPTPTALEATPVRSPEATANVQPTEEGTPEENGFPQDLGGAVQVFVIVRQRSWLQVLVDGVEAFSGRVLPGSVYPFSGDEQVEVLTGNAAGIEIFYNQQELGPMGFFGEVANRIFTINGMLTPTPTLSPTPTITQPVTPTPVVTPTPTVSP